MKKTLSITTGITLCTLTLLASTAGAAVTKGQGRCQSGAAKAAVRFFAAEAKSLAGCADAIGRGELPPVTNCRSSEADDLADIAETFDESVAAVCLDADVASLRYAGVCAAASTAADLQACMAPAQQSQNDALLARIYSTAVLPTGDGIECRELVSKEARKLVAKGVGALNKCKNLASKDKIPARTRCEENADYLAALAKLRAKFEAKVTAGCAPGSFPAAAFGEACATATTATDLGICIEEGIAAMQAVMAPAQYGDGGLCGDAHNGIEGRAARALDDLDAGVLLLQMAGKATTPTSRGYMTLAAGDIPPYGLIDGPRGVGKIAGNATAFPVGMARGATWDLELERRVGEAIGRETRAKGASVILAPVTAVVRNPLWGRSQESYGEDPFHLGAMGTAFVQGAQQHVMASVKHFAVNSIEDYRFSANILLGERTLREIYLPHFQKVVIEGEVATVMSAYNSVNGLHCDMNPHLLTDILKGEWGFRGFVESDWSLGTHDTAASANAGLDLEMPSARQFTPFNFNQAIMNNEMTFDVVREANRRKFRQAYCFRIDDDPPVVNPAAVETPEHLALAQEVAERAIVLLKNDGAALPLSDLPSPTIVVIGHAADLVNIGDEGSSQVIPSSAITALEGLVARNTSGSVVHVTGDPNEPSNVAAIGAADAVVVVTGLTKDDEGESFISVGDRDSYAMSAARETLIKDVAALSSRTIVVLEGGSAIGVEEWIDDVEALVMAWYPGMEGGAAIARVLFGDVNPSGKLPLVWAATDADLPPIPPYPPDDAAQLFLNPESEVPKDVSYGYYHGYRLLDRDGKNPRFPFGYGLSYTTFAYSNLTVVDPNLQDDETLEVTFDVTNTGSVAGEEVAQLYVNYPASAVDRPDRDLRAFTRVALEPGETKQVQLTVPVADLAWYDEALPGWSVEHVLHGVEVGSSSRDLPLSSSFQVEF
jgi:beta-glucosidase